jgi:putative phage-type endonuclease
MRVISLNQGTPEWLDYRKTKICASDIASVMGLNPYKSPWECYQEKNGNKFPFVSDRMRRGVELEPEARSRVNEVLEAHYVPLCVEHEIGWMFASLDGYDAGAQVPIVEIKCPGLETHRIACDDKVPPLYYPQLQFQMYVAGV